MTLDGRTAGLALSGGGFRATLFGLGSLWRLNDAGLLGKLDRITSVSGGSIVAGVLAHRWHELQFADGRAENFTEVIAEPVRAFCGKTIDIREAIAGLLMPFKTPAEFLTNRYQTELFGNATIKDIPVAQTDLNPKFIFYGTNMQTGRSFRFQQDMISDYMLGISTATNVSLSLAIAASSAFPPMFSPVILETDPDTWSEGGTLPDLAALRRRIVLADGGIYDNLGLESLINHVDIAMVSDAGAPFVVDENPAEDHLLQMGRVQDILTDQTRALRKRWLISEFEAGRKQGAYWGIGTSISAYHSAVRMSDDSAISESLKEVPTRLSAFSEDLEGYLVNWGYALCDVSLRARVGLRIPPAASWPVPEWPL